MAKLNCWDVKRCGRQPGGHKTAELGVCEAATSTAFHGVHGGTNGGRACWIVTGTLCGGKVQGMFAQKSLSCNQCDFYKTVRKEEGKSFQPASALLQIGQR